MEGEPNILTGIVPVAFYQNQVMLPDRSFPYLPVQIDQGCPATYADPTQDPRMQR